MMDATDIWERLQFSIKRKGEIMKIPDGFLLNGDDEYMAFMAKIYATLKPCPFCGSKNPQAYWYGDSWAMACVKCYAMGPRTGQKENTETENTRALVKAVEAWNKRTAEEELCRH
jgi:hypothetical protein